MRKGLAVVMLFFIQTVLYASDTPPLVLDKVSLQLTARDWVSTDKALLHINVNMTLNNADMVQARADILKNLKRVAEGEWHITRFDRSQDSSGLEKLYVQAQARVEQKVLTNVYQQAKGVSKPGASYKVDSIDFTPGLIEREQVKNKLREKLYHQVQQELQILNKSYSEQHYTVNRLIFVEGEQQPMPAALKARQMNTMVMAAEAAAPVSVSNEMILSVVAELASNRQPSVNKND